MRRTCRTKILFLVLVSIFFCNIIGNPEAVYAAGNNVISGKVYQLKEDDDYDFTAAEETTAVKPMGTLRISGNLSDAGGMDGVTAYIVNKGNAEFEYLFKSAILDAEEGEWQLDNCNENKICGVKLDGKIKSGALIIESSLDGVNWTSDSNQTDIFASKEELSEAFYKTKDVQQENGCYYRRF